MKSMNSVLILLALTVCCLPCSVKSDGLADDLMNSRQIERHMKKLAQDHHVVHLESSPGSDPTIDAVIFNELDIDMRFISCNITGGEQVYDIIDPLPSQEKQMMRLEPSPSVSRLISGTCYYNMTFPSSNDKDTSYDEHVLLDVIFYKNARTGHEFYGLTNYDLYHVMIKIVSPGDVAFFIWN